MQGDRGRRAGVGAIASGTKTASSPRPSSGKKGVGMLFTSGEFIFVFLPLVLVSFFLVARFLGHRAAAFWLVVASLVFYGDWRWLLVAAIATNLAVLAYFKYANFFVRSVSAVSGMPLGTFDILLPLGISF